MPLQIHRLTERRRFLIVFATGALAGELVKFKVDIIVTATAPGVRAVRQATTTIPIVMMVIGNPVGDGLVANLARPGGNITGMSN